MKQDQSIKKATFLSKNNIFQKIGKYHIELGGRDLIDFFISKGDDKRIFTSEFYIKKQISSNQLLIRKKVSKKYAASDILLLVDKDQKLLNVKVMPSISSYTLVLLIPIVAYFIYTSNESLPEYYYALPFALPIIIFLLIRWTVNSDFSYVEKEILSKTNSYKIRS